MTRARTLATEDAPRSTLPWFARPAFSAGVGLSVIAVIMVLAGLQGKPQIGPPRYNVGITLPTPEPAPAVTAEGSPALPQITANPVAQSVLTGVLIALAVIAGALVLWVAGTVLLRLYRNRPAGKLAGAKLDSGGAAQASAQQTALRDGIDLALASFDTHAPASDAVVAAWVAVEDTVAARGIKRGTAETPAEFADRLAAGDVSDRTALRVVLGAYEDVRFGGVVADQATCENVLAALKQIRQVRS